MKPMYKPGSIVRLYRDNKYHILPKELWVGVVLGADYIMEGWGSDRTYHIRWLYPMRAARLYQGSDLMLYDEADYMPKEPIKPTKLIAIFNKIVRAVSQCLK